MDNNLIKNRCVIRDPQLRFAWIEYDAKSDGIKFCDTFSSELGWLNLFFDLPSAGQYRIDKAHPNLPIKMYGNAILMLPRENEEEAKFLARWIYSPGIKKISDNHAELTFNSDATYMADIICISGHGGGGNIWGTGEGRGSINICIPEENEDIGKTHDFGLKYLIIPACGNVNSEMGRTWLKAFTKEYPIRGILGYGFHGYPGHPRGAAVMNSFGMALKKEKYTILKAWKEANDAHGFGYKWTAFIHDDAMNDTMYDWCPGNLSELSKSGKVRWYNDYTYNVGGIEVKDTPPDIEAIFHMGSENEPITRFNNTLDKESKHIGFFPGGRGHLLIRRNNEPFYQFEKIKVIFYFFRPFKDGMDIRKLLKFDSSIIGPDSLKHFNDEDNTDHSDGFEYEIDLDSDEVWFPYTVVEDSVDFYTSDGEQGSGSEGVHGFFWVAIIPPNSEEHINCYTNYVWLRSLPGLPKVIYESTWAEVGEIHPASKYPEIYELEAGPDNPEDSDSEYSFFFENVNHVFEKEVSIYSEDGTQVIIDRMMSLDVEFRTSSMSADKKSIIINGGTKRFYAKIHDMETLSNYGLADKVFYYKVKYMSALEEPKEFAIKKYRFRFVQ